MDASLPPVADQFQGTVENARAVSGADAVVLATIDQQSRTARVIAYSAPDRSHVRYPLGLASRLFPGLDAFKLNHPVDANPILAESFRTGRTQVTTLRAVAAGMAAPALLDLASRTFGWETVVLCSATVDGRVAAWVLYINPPGVGEREITALEGFARQVSLTLQNAGLYEGERLRRSEAELLLEVSRLTTSTLDLTECMRQTARSAARTVGADMAGLYLTDPDEGVMRPVAAYRVPPDRRETYGHHAIRLRGHPFVERAFASGEAVSTTQVKDNADIDQHTRDLFPCAAVAFVPLLVGKRRLGGLWLVWWQEERVLDERQRRMLEVVARLAATASEHARLLEAERTAREEYQRLVGDIGDGYCVIQDWYLALVNRQLAEMIGCAPEDLIGRPFLSVIAASELERVTSLYQRAIEKGLAVGRIETMVISRDRSLVPVEVSVHPIQFRGRPAFAAVVRDITERRRLEEEDAKLSRQQAELAALSQLNAERSRLITTISHELRTPLSLIRGFSELLLERDYEGQPAKEMAELINEGAVRLSGLVDDIIQYTELAGARVELQVRAVDLSPLLTDCVHEAQRQYPTHRFDLSLPADLPPVSADPNRVMQMVAQLLSNAAKFSPAGEVVRVTGQRSGGFVQVKIIDRGVGIPAADLERIFEPLHRTDKAREDAVQGSGLGLAIVKELVDLHGGQVTAHSRVGEGSTLAFTLPVAP